MNRCASVRPSTTTLTANEVSMSLPFKGPSTPTLTPQELSMKSRFATRSLHPSTTEVSMKKDTPRALTPKSVFHGLARELDLLAPTYAKLHLALHLAHPALSPYPTLSSLLERVTQGPRDNALKELLAGLIAIRQSTPHRLWVAILLRAFRPMLAKLWKTLFGSDCEERLALLLTSFQEALLEIKPLRDPVRIAMYVRQATRRRAIVALKREVCWADDGFGEDVDDVIDPGRPPPEDSLALRKLLAKGALSSHVRESHPSLPRDEQARLCRRLERGRERVFSAKSLSGNEVTL